MTLDRFLVLTAAAVALQGCAGGAPDLPDVSNDEQAVDSCLGSWVTFPCTADGNCNTGCGQQIACIDNEKVRSNVGCSSWTCVELAERYWACHKGVDIVARVGLVGPAYNLCTITPNGWVRHSPAESAIPTHGDLFVLPKSGLRPDGHVAVVNTTGGPFDNWYADTVEQNASCSGRARYGRWEAQCWLHPAP